MRRRGDRSFPHRRGGARTGPDVGTEAAIALIAMPTLTRVFLSFAPEDANYRSLLVAASRAAGLPVRFVETTHHVTDARRRRVLSSAKLQQCDMAVILASPRATRSLTVEADVAAVHEAGLPLHAIVAGRPVSECIVPAAWGTSSVIGWNWPRILEFLQCLSLGGHELRRAG